MPSALGKNKTPILGNTILDLKKPQDKKRLSPTPQNGRITADFHPQKKNKDDSHIILQCRVFKT